MLTAGMNAAVLVGTLMLDAWLSTRTEEHSKLRTAGMGSALFDHEELAWRRDYSRL